jgi:hypothetical protein
MVRGGAISGVKGEHVYVMDFHTDLPAGAWQPEAPKGMKYLLVIANVTKGTIHAIPTATREDHIVAQALHEARVEDGTEARRVLVMSDRERAFKLGKRVKRYLRNNKGRVAYSIPGRSNTNARAERAVRTAVEGMTATLAQAALPLKFWPWAVRAWSVYHNHAAGHKPRLCELEPVGFGLRGRIALPSTVRHRYGCESRGIWAACLGPDLGSRFGWQVLFADRDGKYHITTAKDSDCEWSSQYLGYLLERGGAWSVAPLTPDPGSG